MVFIYILELENNKYYVGKTTNPDIRINNHFVGDGSQWTKKYKPIKVLEIINDCDNFDEDKYTLKTMEKYGINNVRGGSFCKIILSDENITTLKQIMNSVSDKCYICGNKDHFANNCNVKNTKIATINLDEKCDCITSRFSSHRRSKCLLNNIITYFDDEDVNINKLIVNKNDNKCFRCGREGHYSDNCYAKTTISGEKIEEELVEVEVFYCSYCNKEFDTLKGATCHENLYCKKKKNDNKCFRCGREGHYSDNCYASKHVNGKYLN